MTLAIHDSIKFLEKTSEYFEKRPTGGEDKAYWANVYNAEHCRETIKEIEKLRIENIQMKFALGYPMPADLEHHIIPTNPFKCGVCDARKVMSDD